MSPQTFEKIQENTEEGEKAVVGGEGSEPRREWCPRSPLIRKGLPESPGGPIEVHGREVRLVSK